MEKKTEAKPRRPLPVVAFLYAVVAILAISIAAHDVEIWLLMVAIALYSLGLVAIIRDHRRRLQKWKAGRG